MISKENFIPFEISKDDEKSDNNDTLNSKFHCKNCQKKCFSKKRYDLDVPKFLIFSFLLMGSFSLLSIILVFSFIRNKFFKKINKDDIFIKARERRNFLGLVFPQKIDTICLDCNNTIKTDKDPGDFTIAICLFIMIVVCVLIFLKINKLF